MVKIREPRKPELADAEKAAKAEKFGNDALPKSPRIKPAGHYKSINIPFTEDDYKRLVEAAALADRKPTDFIKKAIKRAVDDQLKKH